MFQLKFAHTYDNNAFSENNLKPVVEDYYRIEKNIFCIADGVTRDSIYGSAMKYPKNKEEAEKWMEIYPNPSGAFDAAKICADYFVKYLLEKTKEEINEQNILQIVKKVNEIIYKINEGREIDYLANDLFSCVAVGGYIGEDDFLYCFSIGDCHIALVDDEFNIVFTTINNHKQFENYLNNVYCKEHEYDWTMNKYREMVRRDYRNKPQMKYKGEEVSFGVLSGEKEAEHYIDTYKVSLNKVKYICAYSDGCEELLNQKNKLKEILQKPETLKDKGEERTLIIYERMENK